MRNKLVISFIITALFWICMTQDYNKDEKIIGLTESELISKFKEPLRETTIFLHSESKLHEYQSDLYLLAKETNEFDTLVVKEMCWKLKKKNQVVWLMKKEGEWQVFDNLSWSKDVQF